MDQPLLAAQDETANAEMSSHLMFPMPDVPERFQTSKNSLKSLGVCFLATCVTSGPLQSFPTLLPVLAAEGVFSGPQQLDTLAMVYVVASAGLVIPSLLFGILFDVYGPRRSSVAGAVVAFVGLLLMTLGVSWRSTNWLIFPGYFLALAGGSLNTNGIYGFIFVMPDRQNLVNAAASSAQAVSDSMAVLIVPLAAAGVHSRWFFLTLSLLSIASIPVYLMITPRKALCDDLIRFGTQSEIPPPITSFVQLKRYIHLVWATAKLNPRFHLYYMLFMGLLLNWLITYFGHMYSIFAASVGAEAATSLVTWYAIIYAVISAAGSPMYGVFIDRKGMVPFINFAMVAMGVCVVTHVTPWVPSLYLGLISSSMLMASLFLMVPRFAQLYCAPSLFGSYQGIMFTALGLTQALVAPITSSMFAGLPQPYRSLGPSLLLGIATAIAGLRFAYFLNKEETLPEPGSVPLPELAPDAAAAATDKVEQVDETMADDIDAQAKITDALDGDDANPCDETKPADEAKPVEINDPGVAKPLDTGGDDTVSALPPKELLSGTGEPSAKNHPNHLADSQGKRMSNRSQSRSSRSRSKRSTRSSSKGSRKHSLRSNTSG